MDPQKSIRRVGRVKAAVVALALAASGAVAGGLAVSGMPDQDVINGHTTEAVPSDPGGFGISLGSGSAPHTTTKGS